MSKANICLGKLLFWIILFALFITLGCTDEQPIAIEGEPTAFGFWVHGDGRGLTPRLRVRDTTGQTWQPTGPSVDWHGWRYVEMSLDRASGHWGGAGDGIIHFPLAWDSLALLDNTSRRELEGTLYLAAPCVRY